MENMPKSDKKNKLKHLQVGSRVIYTHNNVSKECWIERFTSIYVVLRPCFRSYCNHLIHHFKSDHYNNIKPYKGRKLILNQLVYIDDNNKTKAIIIDLKDDMVTVQIYRTRINHKLHRDSPRLLVTNETDVNYIPYTPINFEAELQDPYMFNYCMINDIKGYILDYDYDVDLYLFFYYFLGEHHVTWVNRDDITVISKHTSKYNHIGSFSMTYEPTCRSSDHKLILLDLYRNSKWYNMHIGIKKLFDLYFVKHSRERFRTNWLDNISKKEIMDKLLAKIKSKYGNEMYEKKKTLMGKNEWFLCSYNLNVESYHRSLPYFDLKIQKKEDNKVYINVYLNDMIDKIGHFSNKILPIVDFLNPINKFDIWSNKDTLSLHFWKKYWKRDQLKEDIKKYINTKSYLYPHQQWAVNKMVKMEKNKISHIFNQELWGHKFNFVEGFVDILKWIKTPVSNGGILALGTGLGKTICCIDLIKRNPCKTLIVVPLSLLDQWKQEITKFYPEISVSEYYGKKKSLLGNIILTTYGTICNLQNKALRIVVERVIFDECHVLKSSQSNTTYACAHNIQAKYRWCVTATPFKNSLLSLLPYLKILRISPWCYGNSDHTNHFFSNKLLVGHMLSNLFIKLDHDTELFHSIGICPIKTNQKQIYTEIQMSPDHTIIYQYMFNKIRDEIGNLLHYGWTIRKYNQVVMLYNQLYMISLHPCSLNKMYYGKKIQINGIMQQTTDSLVGNTQYEKEMCEKLKKNQKDESCVICMEPFSRPTLTKCFHVFCHDCIIKSLKHKKSCPQCRTNITENDLTEMVDKIDMEEDKNTLYYFDLNNVKREMPKVIDNIYKKNINSGKINYIVEKIRNNKSTPFVIFSQFTTSLTYLKKILKQHDITFEMIDGKKSRVQRKKALENFKSKSVQVFLLSTKIASVGLTLTTSFHMIFLEPIIDNQVFKQAIGRLYRIGQKNNVTIEVLHTKNTIENIEKINQFQEKIIDQQKNNLKKMKMKFLFDSLEY